MGTRTREKHGFRALAETVQILTEPALKKRGLANVALVAEWPQIVGEAIGKWSMPEKLVFPPRQNRAGVLHVRVGSSAMALEFQHTEPVIIERINVYFGYPAVARLRLRHAPMPAGPKAAAAVRPELVSRKSGAVDETALSESVTAVGEGDLRQALIRLGRTLPPPRQTDD
jgi:hypothetical protein